MSASDLLEAPAPSEATVAARAPRREPLEIARAVVTHPLFLPIALAFVALLGVFWPMTSSLYGRWTQDEYYSHGFLVPLLVGYIVFKRWPLMRETPVEPTAWALLPMALMLPVLAIAYLGKSLAILSVLFVAYTLCAIAFIAGRRWTAALFPAVAFTLFALPAWNSFIESATNPLQLASAKVAFQILGITGFNPTQFPNQPTLIFLNSYQFEVAVACSGMKLLLAVSAFTMLFVLVANTDQKYARARESAGAGVAGKVGLWLRGILTPFNVLMVAIIVPLCLLVNGLRIAMIGMVGELQGADAAAQFHDWSGYIMLLVCFFILFKFARLFGWRD